MKIQNLEQTITKANRIIPEHDLDRKSAAIAFPNIVFCQRL